MRLCVINTASLPDTVAECAATASSLPFGRAEAERIASHGSIAAARQSLGALLALESLAKALPRDRLTIRRTPSGKPYFPALPSVGFSLTHVVGFSAAALAEEEGEIGLDLERIDGTRRYQSIAGRFFDDAEQALLQTASDPLLCFYRLWTQKEAVAKVSGNGLFRTSADRPCVTRHLRLTADKTSLVLCLAARASFDLQEIQLPINMKQEELP